MAAAEVARRSGFARNTLTSAESKEFSTLGAKNLAQVLMALGLTHDQWLMLLAADWDGSPSGWNRYRLIAASHLLTPRRLSELVHRAEQMCHEDEIELPNGLPKPPPKVEKSSRLVAVRERAKVLPGGHLEEVVRVFEAADDPKPRAPAKKGIGHGQSALPETARRSPDKARKRSG